MIDRKTFAAALMALTSLPAWAGSPSAWVETEQTSLRLIAAAEAAAGNTVMAGLHFRMQPGWRVYWRSPGDAGFPPRIDWSGSENLAGADILWPAPMRFSILGFDTLGYENEVVLPIDIRVLRPNHGLRLQAGVDYLTCKDICIPYRADLTLALPGAGAMTPRPSPDAQLLARYRTRIPGDGAGQGLAIEAAWTEGSGPATRLKVLARAAFPFAQPDLFVEAPPAAAFARPAMVTGDGGRTALLSLPLNLPGPDASVPQQATLTLTDGLRSAERTLPILTLPPDHIPLPGGTGDLLAIVALALLGGLILNLMPCVLPVLSLKILGLVGHGGQAPRGVRTRFLATAAGIVTTFLAMAGVLATLKAGGMAIGWGIQFQEPWFLAIMIAVLLAFALNLWGAFAIPLPRWLADMGTNGRTPGTVDGKVSPAADFLTGVLATLLATPCSAPLLGTAVGFALSRGPSEIGAVFAALGLGLALPYLAVAAFPRLAARLPRPGAWMQTLRRLLGLGLAATAVWLAVVLATVIGPDREPERNAGRSTVAQDGRWVAFDPSRIPALVAQGKTVLVDVTADWCLTCLTNKALVLDRGAVAARLTSSDIVAMKADWTRPDPAIAAYLASFGRFGIPFNVVYGPAAPLGLPLPEILTPGAVLAVLDRAGGMQPVAGR